MAGSDWIEWWANSPGPYRRTVLVVAGLAAYLPGISLINEIARFMRHGPQPPAGTAPMDGGVGAGLISVPIVLTAISVAGGLVCLGAAVPAGERRPLIALPAGVFDGVQRGILTLAGLVMLGCAILGILSLEVLHALLLVGLFVLPLLVLLGYFLVLGAFMRPFENLERGLRWCVDVGVAGIGFLGANWILVTARGGELFPVAILLGGLPAITVLAGWVDRVPVVTYISRD